MPINELLNLMQTKTVQSLRIFGVFCLEATRIISNERQANNQSIYFAKKIPDVGSEGKGRRETTWSQLTVVSISALCSIHCCNIIFS